MEIIVSLEENRRSFEKNDKWNLIAKGHAFENVIKVSLYKKETKRRKEEHYIMGLMYRTPLWMLYPAPDINKNIWGTPIVFETSGQSFPEPHEIWGLGAPPEKVVLDDKGVDHLTKQYISASLNERGTNIVWLNGIKYNGYGKPINK